MSKICDKCRVFSACNMSKLGGASTAAILTMMLQVLVIPSEIMAIILTSASQFYSGISTFTDVYSNLAVATLVSPRNKQKAA